MKARLYVNVYGQKNNIVIHTYKSTNGLLKIHSAIRISDKLILKDTWRTNES